MKRTALLAITLLVVNILIEGFVAFAFLYGFFRDDMVITGVFGAVAVLGMLPQPWYIAFLPLPLGMFYAPIAATIVTLMVYRWLDRYGKMPSLFARLRMMRWKRFVVCGVIALVLFASFGYARLVDFPALNHHTPDIISYNTDKLGIRDNLTYCISNFLGWSEWLWQARVTAQQMAALRSQFDLNPVATSKVPKEFFNKYPYWWQPKVKPTVHAYQTRVYLGNSGGEDGMNMLAIWDQQSQVLHMWIMFDN